MPKRVKDLPIKTASPAADDYVSLDGSANGSRGILANDFAAYVGGTRAFAPHFRSDGATANRALVQTPGARGNLAGVPVASWVGWVEVPTSNPISTITIIATSNTTTLAGVPWRCVAEINATGQLTIFQNGALSGTDQRRREFVNFVAVYAGQRIWMEIRFFAGTSAPVVRINGADKTSSFADNNIGASPDWLPSSMVNTVWLTGFGWTSGTAPHGCWLNAHLTNAESEAWRITGRAPAWVSLGGSMVNLSALANSILYGAADTNATAVSANTFNCAGSVEAGARTGGAGAYFARGTATGAGSANIGLQIGTVYPVGRKFLVRLWLKSSVAQTVALALKQNNSRTSDLVNVAITNAWAEYAVLLDNSGNFDAGASGTNQLDVIFTNYAAGVTVDVDDVQIWQAGALSLLRPQVIPVADDWTTIGGNSARCVGIQGITDDPTWRISADTTTNGNQQLLGGNVLDSTRDIIDQIEQVTTGTPTTTIGSASGGAQYKAASALAAGINPTTLVTRKLASNDIWVGSNSTATVRTTLTGHRAA